QTLVYKVKSAEVRASWFELERFHRVHSLGLYRGTSIEALLAATVEAVSRLDHANAAFGISRQGPDAQPIESSQLTEQVPEISHRAGSPGPSRRRGVRLVGIEETAALDDDGGVAQARLLDHRIKR